jgi:glutathione S-transferase
VRTTAPQVHRLYDFLDSGNGYKARLALTQLGIPFEWVGVDMMAGETRRAPFLAKNPNGRIPLLEFADGSTLAESNAILFFLADGTRLLSDDPFERAQTLQWMFFEQYSHEPYIAVARHWCRHPEANAYTAQELARKREGGRAALAVMEGHLAERSFLVGERYSIADIALYAYTHVADQAGIELSEFGALRSWLDRVRGQPDHIAIDHVDARGG